MQPLTAPGRPQAVRGRWIWRLSGVATIILIGVSGGWGIVRATRPADGGPAFSAVPTRTVTVPQTVTRLNVTSYGAPILVAPGPVKEVTVVEAISFDGQEDPPAVTASVSHGVLTLAAPSCEETGCSVGFAVTVPTSVAVNASSEGGTVDVSGATTADIDSGGAPVTARGIQGALTVTADGGSVDVHGAGSASLDSGGGPVNAEGINGALTVTADGGGIQVHGTGAASLDSGGGPSRPRTSRGRSPPPRTAAASPSRAPKGPTWTRAAARSSPA